MAGSIFDGARTSGLPIWIRTRTEGSGRWHGLAALPQHSAERLRLSVEQFLEYSASRLCLDAKRGAVSLSVMLGLW